MKSLLPENYISSHVIDGQTGHRGVYSLYDVEIHMGINAISGTASYGAVTASTSSSSSTQVYDKKDLNKDGLVSMAEEIQYALAHPEASGATQSAASTNQSYDQQGKLTTGIAVQSTFVTYA